MPALRLHATGSNLSTSNLAYAQARIQSRIGQWPSERDWAALNALNGFAHYLDEGRKTALAPWLQGMRGDQDVHSLELALRQRFLAEVGAVWSWSPPALRSAVSWFRFVPYLALLTYLGGDHPAHIWMRGDPFLQSVLSPEGVLRRDLFDRWGASELIQNIAASPVSGRWLVNLRRRLPGTGAGSHMETGYRTLLRTLQTVLDRHPSETDDRGQPLDLQIQRRLTHAIHTNVASPISPLAYLGLVIWILRRLLAELVSRRTFGAREGFS